MFVLAVLLGPVVYRVDPDKPNIREKFVPPRSPTPWAPTSWGAACSSGCCTVELVRGGGVRVVEGSPVLEVETEGGEVWAVHTPAASWRTGVAISCAGAWAGALSRTLGAPVPVEVRRLLQIVEVERAPEATDPRTLSHDARDLYARPGGASSVWIGGRIPFGAPADPDDVALLPHGAKARSLREAYGGLAAFPLGPIRGGWAGIDGDTPDYQPVLGAVGSVGGLFVAAGFSGHGFKLAPAAGRLMADLVTSGRYELADAASLGAERFVQGKLHPLGYKQMGS